MSNIDRSAIVLLKSAAGLRPRRMAPGVADRDDPGDLSKLTPGELVKWVIQLHDAKRAGRHYDVRFGRPDTGLYSWATRKELPKPGDRTALFQQGLHRYGYGDFQGRIPKGYGAGTVRRHDKGQIMITDVKPGKIMFTTAHKRYPERFTMIRPKGWKAKDWLLINTTPREAVPYNKVRYKKIPVEQVDSLIDKMEHGETLEAKIDGASSLIKLLEHGVELVSYRTSKTTGLPIVHTEKFFGGPGKMKIPKKLVGTVLKGELYASKMDPAGVAGPAGGDGAGGETAVGDQVARSPMAMGGVSPDGSSGSRNSDAYPGAEDPRDSAEGGRITAGDRRLGEGDRSGFPARNSDDIAGRAGDGTQVGQIIGPQQLGGILNASLAEALRKLREGGIDLRDMIYDIQQHGKEPVDWHTTPRLERREMIKKVLEYLPKDKFHISEAAETPEEALKLWNRIQQTGYTPATEGVVFHPLHGKPIKSKLLEDSDVHVKRVFPGAGKYMGLGAGGFEYALEPGGPTIGRVGTGFTDELRRDLFRDPAAYIGRVARIRAQQQYPSGAYRAPSLIGFHEDYPSVNHTKQAGAVQTGISHTETARRGESQQAKQGISQLGGNEASLLQSAEGELQVLRGTWNNGLSKMANIVRELPSGHGSMSAGPFAGTQEQRKGLQPIKLLLANHAGADAEQTIKSADFISWKNASADRLGSHDRYSVGYHTATTGPRLAGGARVNRKTRSRKKSMDAETAVCLLKAAGRLEREATVRPVRYADNTGDMPVSAVGEGTGANHPVKPYNTYGEQAWKDLDDKLGKKPKVIV